MARANAQIEQADVLVFVSYSHRDERSREQFDVHTAQLRREGVRFWFDHDILAGAELDPNIRRQLKAADIVVALASPEYLASDYCFDKEYAFALRKAGRGKVHVVVALIKQCQWRHTRMKFYKMLPKDAKAVSQWARHGDAFENIIEGLREVVKVVRLAKAGGEQKKPARQVRKPAAKAKPAGRPKSVAARPKRAAPRKRPVAKNSATKKKATVRRKPASAPKPRKGARKPSRPKVAR